MPDISKQTLEAIFYPIRFYPAYFKASMQKTGCISDFSQTTSKVIGIAHTFSVMFASTVMALETYNRTYALTQRFWMAASVSAVTGLYAVPRLAASTLKIGIEPGIMRDHIPEARNLFFVPSLAESEEPANEI